MKKLTDQELDSVFKNAADGYQPVFDQSAWEAMNAKLDEPRPNLWKRWMPFAFFGLLIFSGGVWVGTYLNDNESTQVLTATTGKESVQPDAVTNLREGEVPKNEQQTASHNQINANGNAVTSNEEKINTEPTEQVVQQLKADPQLPENRPVIMISENNNPADETKFLLQQEKLSSESLSPVPDNLLTESRKDSIQNPVEENKEDTVNSNEKDDAQKTEQLNSRGFYLRLLASPDFSSINYSTSTSMGSNYSVLIDYQFSNRWSLSTGAIWSKKVYSSDNEFTYGAYTADRMAGDCRILDIPINVNYQFPSQSKISFYAALGISSYFMMEEDYTYTFDTPSGSRNFSSYFKSENTEWFKVLNVSFGVQYRIAPRFHFQVEPFLKAPLAGVGEWDVKLSSLGMFLGLKYKLK